MHEGMEGSSLREGIYHFALITGVNLYRGEVPVSEFFITVAVAVVFTVRLSLWFTCRSLRCGASEFSACALSTSPVASRK